MTTKEHPVTAHTHGIIIRNVDHFAGARLTHRTWYAIIERLTDDAEVADCGHRGHRTVEAAKACGLKKHAQVTRSTR